MFFLAGCPGPGSLNAEMNARWEVRVYGFTLRSLQCELKTSQTNFLTFNLHISKMMWLEKSDFIQNIQQNWIHMEVYSKELLNILLLSLTLQIFQCSHIKINK